VCNNQSSDELEKTTMKLLLVVIVLVLFAMCSAGDGNMPTDHAVKAFKSIFGTGRRGKDFDGVKPEKPKTSKPSRGYRGRVYRPARTLSIDDEVAFTRYCSVTCSPKNSRIVDFSRLPTLKKVDKYICSPSKRRNCSCRKLQ